MDRSSDEGERANDHAAAPAPPAERAPSGDWLPAKDRPSGCVLVPLIVFCIVYLVNPTWGMIEMIPDNVPVIGNLDEAGALLLLLRCLSYYGIDLKWLHPGRQEPLQRPLDDDPSSAP